jgi:hypothetical protein
MARDDAALSAFSLRSSAVAIGVRRWRVADRSVANETFDTGGHIVPREHARIMIIVAAAVRTHARTRRGGYRSWTLEQITKASKTSSFTCGIQRCTIHVITIHKTHNHRSRGDTPRKAQTLQFSAVQRDAMKEPTNRSEADKSLERKNQSKSILHVQYISS